MDAVEFLKKGRQMCDSFDGCDGCPGAAGACFINDTTWCKNPEGVVAAVEKWAKDHPAKTRQSEFLKMFPKVPMKDDVIDICPATVVKGLKNAEHCNHILCEDCRKAFWLMEVTDND